MGVKVWVMCGCEGVGVMCGCEGECVGVKVSVKVWVRV